MAPSSSDPPRPLTAHLAELRGRLLWCVGGWGAAMAALLMLPSVERSAALRLLRHLKEQLTPPGTALVFLDPLEPVAAAMKLAGVGAAVLMAPVWLYHLYAFLAPAVGPAWRRSLAGVTAASAGLFLAGAVIAYRLIIPATFRLCVEYGVAAGALPQLAMGRFVGTVGWMVLLFSLPFELPLVLGGLARVGVVSVQQLRAMRRFAYLGIAVGAAVATPDPTMFSMVVLTVILWALYEVGIALAGWVASGS